MKNLGFSLFLFLIILIFVPARPAIAQFRSLDIAVTHSLSDTAKPGDIVSIAAESGILEPAKIAYDDKMFGVVVETPAFVIKTADSLPVSRTGVAIVNVSTLAGNINPGDFITSSSIPGHGQKADNLGSYMLGIALEKFDQGTGTETDFANRKIYIGQMRVEIGIGPASPVLIKASGGLLGTVKQIAASLLYNISVSRNFEKIIRYIVAALVSVVVIFINFNTFGKNITKGIEGIGRNPLAKFSIQSMIVVNVVLIAIVTLGGIILSLAILSL